MTTRYRDGAVTVTLDGGLEAFVRKAVEASLRVPLSVLEAEAEVVAAEGRGKWYKEVNRRTGRSGDIRVVTTVSTTEVRVSIGSTDTRLDKRGRAAALFVRAPGPLSQLQRRATKEEYRQARAAGKSHGSALWVSYDNPKRSDGHFLIQTLVRKPGQALAKATAQKLSVALAREMGVR